MKNWLSFGLFLSVSLVFSGCSTQQYFTLANATDETISIYYTIENPPEKEGIFSVPSEIFQADATYQPDPDHPLPYADLNFADNSVHLKLPPKSVLVLGRVFNDTYNASTQTTAQGKVFNLQELKFRYDGTDFTINKENFHDFFIEDKGTFRYIVQ